MAKRQEYYFRVFLLLLLFPPVMFMFLSPNSPLNVESDRKPVDVLFIGDSITYGWNTHPEKLSAAFGSNVVVEGVDGIDTLDLNTILMPTKNFKSRLSIPWWKPSEIANPPFADMHFALKMYAPRIVVLEIGVNNWVRVQIGRDKEQMQGYIASRNYKNLTYEDIQEDSAIGSINKRGVYQIVMRLRELYGEDIPIIVVGAFPLHFAPDPAIFNAFLKEFSEDRNSPVSANLSYLDSMPIAHIAWSEEHGMFYDHSSFPAQKEQYDTIHVDWGHLNGKGYEVFAKMLECPVKKALKEYDGACRPITAVDMNVALDE
jgi:lysophospholipase L1-like esterase